MKIIEGQRQLTITVLVVTAHNRSEYPKLHNHMHDSYHPQSCILSTVKGTIKQGTAFDYAPGRLLMLNVIIQ